MSPAKGTPKRGVSLFSYQCMKNCSATLEDYFEDLADMGATCIEILASDVENYPNPSTAWVDKWFGLCEKYGITPGGYGHWCDTKLYGHRRLTTDEAVANLVRDFKLANLLGFHRLRTKITTETRNNDPEPGWEKYIEKALPFAEKYDVVIGSEIHDPTVISTPHVAEYIKFIERTGTEHFGFTLDFSTFQDPAKINAAHFRPPVDDPASTREDLLGILPYVRHCHAKFYFMSEDFTEPAIPYEWIVPTLVDNGYSDCIISEYQGGSKDDAFIMDQLRRHHVMLKRLLGY
ncbi:MAG: sugar phosphate isomerase/epimerase [Propionibacteriaceae bacterium]|jgi:hypothetical protein|nr:sugar phosphate isomerase/epimerase [Propionibacteriaceae bacterium]